MAMRKKSCRAAKKKTPKARAIPIKTNKNASHHASAASARKTASQIRRIKGRTASIERITTESGKQPRYVVRSRRTR